MLRIESMKRAVVDKQKVFVHPFFKGQRILEVSGKIVDLTGSVWLAQNGWYQLNSTSSEWLDGWALGRVFILVWMVELRPLYSDTRIDQIKCYSMIQGATFVLWVIQSRQIEQFCDLDLATPVECWQCWRTATGKHLTKKETLIHEQIT